MEVNGVVIELTEEEIAAWEESYPAEFEEMDAIVASTGADPEEVYAAYQAGHAWL